MMTAHSPPEMPAAELPAQRPAGSARLGCGRRPDPWRPPSAAPAAPPTPGSSWAHALPSLQHHCCLRVHAHWLLLSLQHHGSSHVPARTPLLQHRSWTHALLSLRQLKCRPYGRGRVLLLSLQRRGSSHVPAGTPRLQPHSSATASPRHRTSGVNRGEASPVWSGSLRRHFHYATGRHAGSLVMQGNHIPMSAVKPSPKFLHANGDFRGTTLRPLQVPLWSSKAAIQVTHLGTG